MAHLLPGLGIALAGSYCVFVVSVLVVSAVTSTVLVSETTSAVLPGSVALGSLEHEASSAPRARAGPASHSGRQDSGFIS